MLIVFVLFFALLTFSCIAPITYQVVTLCWPRVAFPRRWLISLAAVIVSGFCWIICSWMLYAFGMISGQRDVLSHLAALLPGRNFVIGLYGLAIVAVGMTIAQLFLQRSRYTSTIERTLLVAVLAVYGCCLLVALSFVARL
jgi:hypothetical protein